MTTRFILMFIVALAISNHAAAAQKSKTRSNDAQPSAPTKTPLPAESPSSTKVVAYNQRDVVRLNLRVRYTTLVVLPKEEVILDFVCGDKELWVIDGEQNFAYIKPAKEGTETNLNLVTASGNIYSFLLNEVSGTKVTNDLKVFVNLADPTMAEATKGPRRLASVQELEDVRAQVQTAHDELQQVKQGAQNAIDRGIAQFVTNVRFAYRFEAGKKPFYVRAMYHDDRFTYIQARPEETPTLVELRDGKPNLVNFSYENGVYVADRILDKGYLTVGKAKLPFEREE
jgi:type IV secretory pathway VirB9-like protein